MFNIDLSRTVLAAIGALVLSAVSVAAAVGPARLAETAPVVYAEAAASAEGGANA